MFTFDTANPQVIDSIERDCWGISDDFIASFVDKTDFSGKLIILCTFVDMLSAGAAGTQIGVRYIMEDLIRKLTKQEHLGHVTSLNLTLAKDNGKKIKVSYVFDSFQNYLGPF